jgi:hypothetical protein
VLPVDLRAHLRGSLEQAPAPTAGAGDRLAAVLALLVEDDGSIVFTERAAGLSRHAGEVSFPGGLAEVGDGSLARTALREAWEEIGLDPALPEVLGALPPVHTYVSGILVTPFVAVVDGLPSLAPADGEIARVLTVPIERLVAAERTVTWSRPGGRLWTGWVYVVEDATIWGATGSMLHDLLLRLPDGVRDLRSKELRRLLGDDARTIAVVGLSSKPHRPSNAVARFLQDQGYRIVPVNPNESEVLGERAYPSLRDVPPEIRIDVVDVFRRAEETPPIAADAVAVRARMLWLQEGIVNEEAARIAAEGGLDVVMGVCIRHPERVRSRGGRT